MRKSEWKRGLRQSVLGRLSALLLVLAAVSCPAYTARAQEAAAGTEDGLDGVIVESAEDADILGISSGLHEKEAWQVLDILNRERAKAGLPALTMDKNLMATANLRAKEIVTSFSHTRPNGQDCFSVFPSVVAYPIGENIAAGHRSPEEVMRDWMASAGHRENILLAGYKSVGISCYYDPNGYYGYYWVQCFGGSVTAKANRPGATVYDGVDYSAVYDYDYYVSKYDDVRRAFGTDYAGALKHFVTNGMKEGRRGNSAFDVVSYANANYDLRKAYKNDLRKYYIHYINCGKKEGRKSTNVKRMKGGPVYYGGINYSAVYDTGYYANKYSDLKKAYGFDDDKYLAHFVKKGMKEGRQAKSEFKVQKYMKHYSKLRKKYGNNLKKYYLHYIKKGKKAGYKGN